MPGARQAQRDASAAGVPAERPSDLYPGKRLLDLVVGALGLLALGVLFPVIALAIKLDSPGPVLFRQWRVGRGGRWFRLSKFRSMRSDSDRIGWTRRGDTRVTRVGRILRRLHLDELPQMVSVLRGEMSAVGPRPERPELMDLLARELPTCTERLAVRPGLTSWSAVENGYASTVAEARLRLECDLRYIENASLGLDLWILLHSLLHAVTLQGR